MTMSLPCPRPCTPGHPILPCCPASRDPVASALPQVGSQGDVGTVAGSPCLASGTSTWTSSRSCWSSAAYVGTRLPMPCRTSWPPTWSHASLSPRQVLSASTWANPQPGSQDPGCTWTDHFAALVRPGSLATPKSSERFQVPPGSPSGITLGAPGPPYLSLVACP